MVIEGGYRRAPKRIRGRMYAAMAGFFGKLAEGSTLQAMIQDRSDNGQLRQNLREGGIQYEKNKATHTYQ